MKKMNNYEAPKAEVIELNMNKDLMQDNFGSNGNGTGGAGSFSTTNGSI